MNRLLRMWFLATIVALMVLTSWTTAYTGTWDAITPEVIRDSDDVDDDTDIEWSMTTAADGLTATGDMWPIDKDDANLRTKSLSIFCSRRIGYQWNPECGEDPVSQTFTLTWSGNVSENTCTSSAKGLDDYSKSTELGFVKVTSGDFTDDAGDWQRRSNKEAMCPQNSGENQEGKITSSGKIPVQAGLPTSITGSQERTVSGNEASDTPSAGASTAVYVHPGGGTNTIVDATAHHTSAVTFELNCGDIVNPGVDGRSKAKARTTNFTITKG